MPALIMSASHSYTLALTVRLFIGLRSLSVAAPRRKDNHCLQGTTMAVVIRRNQGQQLGNGRRGEFRMWAGLSNT